VSREREVAIVRAAFENGGMTRERLMSTLHLNAFSAYTLTADLITRGVLRELPADGCGANGSRKLIAPNPAWGVVAGVHFDHDTVGIGIADFSGSVVAERVVGFDRIRLSLPDIVALTERHGLVLVRLRLETDTVWDYESYSGQSNNSQYPATNAEIRRYFQDRPWWQCHDEPG